jgi:hypothetical protein
VSVVGLCVFTDWSAQYLQTILSDFRTGRVLQSERESKVLCRPWASCRLAIMIDRSIGARDRSVNEFFSSFLKDIPFFG